MNKRIFKIIALALVQVLLVNTLNSFAAIEDDISFKRQGKDALSPGLRLGLPQIRNLFWERTDIAGAGEIQRFLEKWLEKNRRIAGRLRLDEIEQRAKEDFKILSGQIAALTQEINSLIEKCKTHQQKEDFAALIDVFRQNRTFFWNFDNYLQKFIHDNLYRIELKLPKELEKLKEYAYADLDEDKLFSFAVENSANEIMQKVILKAARERLEELEKAQERKKQSIKEKIDGLNLFKEKFNERWRKNDLNLVAGILKDLFYIIKDGTYDYQGGLRKWVMESVPCWNELLNEMELLLEKVSFLDPLTGDEILSELEQAIALATPSRMFFNEQEDELWQKKISSFMEKILKKSNLVPEANDIFCLHMDRKEAENMGKSTHDAIHYVKEALQENKEVVVFGRYTDLSALAEKYNLVDLMKVQVLLVNGEVFLGDDFSPDTGNFLSKTKTGAGNIRLASFPLVFWLEGLSRNGIKPKSPAEKISKEEELLHVGFIYDILLKAYEQYLLVRADKSELHFDDGQIFYIFPFLDKQLYKDILTMTYKNEDEQFRIFIINYMKRIKYIFEDIHYNIFKQALFEAAIFEPDIRLRRRMFDDLTLLLEREKKFFYFAGRIYNSLGQKEKRNLIDFLLSLDLSGFETEEILGIIDVIEKEPEFFKSVFAYLLSTLELQEKDSVDEKISNLFLRRMLSAEMKMSYDMLRFLVEILPKRERDSDYSRGEAVDNLVLLDDSANVAGLRGETIFSKLRRRVHQNPNQDHKEVFYRLLLYWKDLDPEHIDKSKDMLIRSFKDYDFKEYHQAINTLYDSLKSTVPEVIAGRELTAFEIFVLMVDKDKLLRKLKELNAEQYSALEKTAWTIITYQAIARQSGETFAGLSSKVFDQRLGSFPEIEKYRQDFAAKAGEDSGDSLTAYKSFTLLREKIYDTMMSEFSKAGADSEQKEEVLSLLKYDILLERYGQMYFSGIFSEINKIEDIDGLKRCGELLSLIFRNLVYSGFGNAAIEELIRDLQQGELRLSQALNVINSLEFELRKIIRGITADYAGKGVLSAEKIKYKSGFKINYKDLIDKWTEEDEIGRDIAEKLEEMVIARVLRDAGFPALEESLAHISKVLERELSQSGDIILKEKKEIASVNELFLRFGKEEKGMDKGLLSQWGKKGLRLVRMAQAGLPVPEGVVISSEICHKPEILQRPDFINQVELEIKRLREKGEFPQMQLFLFARSGSAYSMPGLLATIPNLGMNDEEVEILAQKTNDPWFAYDSYGNFLRAYGIYVLGIPVGEFQDILNLNKEEKPQDEEGMKDLVDEYKGLIKKHKREIPADILGQVRECLKAIYDSWSSQEAVEYRNLHHISPYWGTAAILQKAVFGNMREKDDGRFSGAGAVTLRFDAYNQPFIEGRFRFNSQGEALMSGAPGNYVVISREEANPGEFSLEEKSTKIHHELLEYSKAVWRLFGQPQRIEFTIQQGKIYLLQSSDSDEHDDADLPQFIDMPETEPAAIGRGAAGGAFRGVAAVDMKSAFELSEKFSQGKYQNSDLDGVVLIVDRVNPEDINRIPQNAAIVAGEMSIHCETLAHKNNIPACYHLPLKRGKDEAGQYWQIREHKFRNGDTISFDGHPNRHVYHKSGFVYKGIVPLKKEDNPNVFWKKRKENNRMEMLVGSQDFIEQAI